MSLSQENKLQEVLDKLTKLEKKLSYGSNSEIPNQDSVTWEALSARLTKIEHQLDQLTSKNMVLNLEKKIESLSQQLNYQQRFEDMDNQLALIVSLLQQNRSQQQPPQSAPGNKKIGEPTTSSQVPQATSTQPISKQTTNNNITIQSNSTRSSDMMENQLKSVVEALKSMKGGNINPVTSDNNNLRITTIPRPEKPGGNSIDYSSRFSTLEALVRQLMTKPQAICHQCHENNKNYYHHNNHNNNESGEEEERLRRRVRTNGENDDFMNNNTSQSRSPSRLERRLRQQQLEQQQLDLQLSDDNNEFQPSIASGFTFGSEERFRKEQEVTGISLLFDFVFLLFIHHCPPSKNSLSLHTKEESFSQWLLISAVRKIKIIATNCLHAFLVLEENRNHQRQLLTIMLVANKS
jgi:hypothetical protein